MSGEEEKVKNILHTGDKTVVHELFFYFFSNICAYLHIFVLSKKQTLIGQQIIIFCALLLSRN
jgi:hypothetical protein